MEILAVIPARSGSKRLPGKNMRFLGGKPLVSWTIETARKCDRISNVLVSTDCEQVAEVAAAMGAMVPWMRPASLSSDKAQTPDVAIHALEWYESNIRAVDAVILLQPTSPFRTLSSIKQGIDLFEKHPRCSIISVSEATTHPWWTLKLENGHLTKFFNNDGLNLRSQDLPPAYSVNGAFYMTPSNLLKSHRSFYTECMVPLTLSDKKELVDIDTLADLKFAEFCLDN